MFANNIGTSFSVRGGLKKVRSQLQQQLGSCEKKLG